MTSTERYVQVADVPENNAAAAFPGEAVEGVDAIKFEVKEYRYFLVEYARIDRDIVIHFFVTERQKHDWPVDVIEKWWLNDFAVVMSTAAQEHFQATLPRIMAKYTHEAASWWFKAQGYDHLLDVPGFLHVFFELLDGTLHSALLQASASQRGRA